MKKALLIFLVIILNIALTMSTVNVMRLGGIPYVKQKVFPETEVRSASQQQVQREHQKFYLNNFKEVPITTSSIVFIGDSLIAACDWSKLLKADIINFGIGGDTTADILNRLDRVAENHPAKIYIMVGVNDLIFKESQEHILINYSKILQTIKTLSPSTKIYFYSVLPPNYSIKPEFKYITVDTVKELNYNLQELCEKHGATYIDLYSRMTTNSELRGEYTVDGLHLGVNGYMEWEEIIQPYMK